MIEVQGLNQLERALTELGRASGFKALTGALRDSSKPVVRESRRAFPKKSGETAKAIKTQVFRGKGVTDSVATLLIGYDKKRAYIGRFIEKGTKAHRVPNKTTGKCRNKKRNNAKVSFGGKVFSNVRHPGSSAKQVLGPAFTRSHPRSIPILKQRLKQRIIIETVKKYGKSAK